MTVMVYSHWLGKGQGPGLILCRNQDWTPESYWNMIKTHHLK